MMYIDFTFCLYYNICDKNRMSQSIIRYERDERQYGKSVLVWYG